MYKYLLFDLDGTLTESGEGIMNSAEYAFRSMGKEVPDRTVLRSFVGPPLKENFPRFGLNEAETAEAIRFFRSYFADRGWLENRPYDGVSDMCRQLADRGYRLIVATSKLEAQAVRIMEYFGLADMFTDIVGGDEQSARSAKADVIEYILNKHGIDRSEAVMIGDRFYDVNGAKACGLDAIGVTYGYGSAEELLEAGAVRVFDTVEELGRYLLDA